MPLTKPYTDDEIKAMLSLIRKAKLELTYPTNFAHIDVKRAFVNNVINEFGEPHEVTEDDTELLELKNVPEHEDGFKVGDIVFLPNLGSDINSGGVRIAGAKLEENNLVPGRSTQSPTPTVEPKPKASVKQEPPAPSLPKERCFRGRVILGTTNEVINGNVYIRVTTSTETYTVSQAEFDADVTNS